LQTGKYMIIPPRRQAAVRALFASCSWRPGAASDVTANSSNGGAHGKHEWNANK